MSAPTFSAQAAAIQAVRDALSSGRRFKPAEIEILLPRLDAAAATIIEEAARRQKERA